MAVTNAVYDGGESKLPQARPTSAVSPAYVDGESGKLPILNYVAAASGFKPAWAVRRQRTIGTGVI